VIVNILSPHVKSVVAQRQPQHAVVMSQHQSTVLPADHAPQGLLPHPGHRDRWFVGIFDASICCNWCSPACCMAWMFPCWPLGQVAEKLKVLGNPIGMNFQAIVFTYCGLLILDYLITTFWGSDLNPHYIFIVVMLYKARLETRKKLQIPGDALNDCCCSVWCFPCVLLQLEHQLWDRPNRTPGCDCSATPAHLP
jgi:Cys-rich protein (TIGR01571 family)